VLDLKDRLQATLRSKYTVEREIGAGGMATVYLARDLKHDREVALKVLRPELSAVLGVDRFLNEIRIAAQLDHPHILTLIDSGEADGLLYYVLPYVRGESLRKRLDHERQLSVDDALAITRQVASALDYAHAKGVVHRDVKPENILIHEGEAILTDFGIAMAVKQAGGNRLTETGLSLGTPQYMSPEQATGDRTLDARSDVYSLAAVLYEMLAGEPPHNGPTSQAVIAKLMTERATRLRVLRDTVPEGVDAAVARALAKVPADRYSNAGQFSRALETAAPDAGSRIRRFWVPATIAAATLALFAVFANAKRHSVVALVSPQRIQLTSNGNAYYPSLSPDGNRLALFEKDCDAEGRCRYRLVVQDIDGTGRLILATGIATVWQTAWTPDGRFIVYGGAYPDSWGAYAIPTLGGLPRRLGCCTAYPLGADTVMVVPTSTRADTVVWVRYVTIRDGTTRDSVPVADPRFDFQGFPTDDPGLFGAHVYSPDQNAELRLINRKGEVVSRHLVEARRYARTRWLPGQGAVLVGIAGDGFKLLRLRVTNGRFESVGDTVMRGLELTTPNPEGFGWFSVAHDGSQIVFGSGPYEASVWTFNGGAKTVVTNATRLLTSTTWASPRISRDGGRVALGRTVSTSQGPGDQLFLIESGGALRQLTAPLVDIRAVEWKADGSGLLVLNFVSAEQATVMEVDTSGLRSTEILRIDRSSANDLRTLRDGSFLLLDPSSRHIRLFDRAGKALKNWDTPEWMPFFQAIMSDWSDGRTLALASFDKGAIHVIVTRLNMQTGDFSSPAKFSADMQGWGRLTWLDDGQLVLSVLESQSRWGLYAISKTNAVRKLAQLPQLGGQLHTTSDYSISGDGRHFSAAALSTRSDIYSIRNLGDILRQ